MIFAVKDWAVKRLLRLTRENEIDFVGLSVGETLSRNSLVRSVPFRSLIVGLLESSESLFTNKGAVTVLIGGGGGGVMGS